MRALTLALAATATCLGCHAAQIGSLVASEAAIVADWQQTRCHAASGWRGTYEQNPLLGPAPSPHTVDLYMGGALVLNAALWYVLPKGWNTAAASVVAGFEAHTVITNERNPCRS